MTAQTKEIPVAWENTSVVRNLEAPYSDEALAEPVKSWIDVDDVDFSNAPHVGLHGPATNYVIKEFGDDIDLRMSSEPEEYHMMFIDAATAILGQERFGKSKIYFTHWSSDLSQGQHFTFDVPHLDGGLPDEDTQGDQLRLVGTATNAVATAILQGGLTREDFKFGTSELKRSVLEEGRLTETSLPLSRLVIMSPATLHHARRAKSRVPLRHFLRWQLRV